MEKSKFCSTPNSIKFKPLNSENTIKEGMKYLKSLVHFICGISQCIPFEHFAKSFA